MNTTLRTRKRQNESVWYPDRMPRASLARRMMIGRSKRYQRFFANDFSALNPTIWANEAIVQLTPNLVTSRMINRDFDDKFAKFGDLVNAFVPGTMEYNRKGGPCDPIVIQDVSGTTMQLPLDQWPQVSFQICDGEEDRSALDLIDTLLTPAVNAFALGIDATVNNFALQFIDNRAGHLGGMSSSTISDYILEVAEEMDTRGVPVQGRTMLVSPKTKTSYMKNTMFTDVSKSGTDDALRRAIMGEYAGFDFVMSQSVPQITGGQTKITAAVNNAGGYTAGTTEIAFDGSSGGTVAVGQWATIVGDDTPQHITAVSGGTSITITPGIKRDVADNAVITIVKPGAVNNVAGYAGTTSNPRVIGWAKEIITDGWTTAPQKGQIVSFGSQAVHYGIIKVRFVSSGSYAIMVDRPLVTAIANDDTVNLGPAGQYNFAFLRDAFVLANRPLAAPRAGAGAIAKTVSDLVNKISIRVTISYDSSIEAHIVTLGTLIGVGTLSEDLGEILLG